MTIQTENYGIRWFYLSAVLKRGTTSGKLNKRCWFSNKTWKKFK